MSELNDLLCCPHCQSEYGFYFNRTEEFLVHHDIGGESISQHVRVIKETKARCENCKKVVVT